MASNDDERIAIELAKGKSDIKAYQAIKGCSYDVAHSNASAYMQANPQVRQKAIDLVEKIAGLTLKDALAGVKDGLGSTYVNRYGEQPDNATRLEATKLLLKLHGELQEKNTSDIHIDNRSVHIELSPEYLHMLNSVMDRFDRMKTEPDVIDGEIVRPKAEDSKTDV
jgi:hypothetical protein